ncbi:MAG TPA: helix-turn-helix transcriptional regulator [Candidatus Limnocylindrales bacterium]|nr:helix-turn-helix transcriptional regulator [Candidatus Limnocylindrales bacterium]
MFRELPPSQHVDPYVRTFADRLRDARHARGWTQRELARRADTDQSTISRAERGLRPRLRLEVVARILIALDRESLLTQVLRR